MTFARDVAYTFRQFRRDPGFWLAVVSTLVLGTSMTTAVFAVVNGVLLRPLPYPDADRVVSVNGVGYRGEYLELRARGTTLDLGAYTRNASASLTGAGEPVRLDVARADAEFFAVLRVQPLAGRLFNADDTRPGAAASAILSYGLWQQRFGGNPTVVGSSITVDGVLHTVLGVMPATMRYPSGAQLWLPLTINPSDRVGLWSNNVWLLGRLRDRMTLARAREEVRALAPSFRSLFPWKMPDDWGRRADVVPLREQITGPVRPMLLVLFGSVGAVLLILCANIANLLSTRGFSRERELAIRAALGASRARLIRQLVIESLTVSAISGVLGAAVAAMLVRLVLPFLPADMPRAYNIAIDAPVLAFALSIALFAGMVFSVLPAFRSTATADDFSTLRSGGINVRAHERRLGHVLAAAEFALATMLVVTAALLARNLWTLMSAHPGFRSYGIVTASVAPSRVRYPRAESRRQFASDLVERLNALPGVESASAANVLPFGGSTFGSVFIIEGRPDPSTQTGDWPGADVRASVTPGYLATLGVPLVEGRGFTAADAADAPRVALFNRTLARKYFGAASPVGLRIRFPGNATPWITIVGVTADVKWRSLGDEASQFDAAAAPGALGAMYLPLAQSDAEVLRFAVRTGGGPERLISSLRGIVQSIDAESPLSNVFTMDSLVAASAARPRFTATLLSCFAAVALLLGAIGVYGILAYAVRRRTQEFAIRMAVGARTGRLLRAVLWEGLRLTLAGIAFGLAGAAATSRAVPLGSAAQNLPIVAAVGLFLIAVGLLAAIVPAWRAVSVSPIVALRAGS